MISQKRHFFLSTKSIGEYYLLELDVYHLFCRRYFLAGNNTFSMDHTVFLYLFFAIVAWAEIHFRNIKIYHNQLVVSRITNPHWLVIDLDKISHVQVSKYQLGFVANTRIYSFILPANSVIEIKELITNR